MKRPLAFLMLSLAVLLAAMPPAGIATLSTGFTAQRSGFQVRVQDDLCEYRVSALFAMPQEKIRLAVANPVEGARYSLEYAGVTIDADEKNGWTWTAPKESGDSTMMIREAVSNETVQFNVFVLVPAAKVKNGILNGYKIGSYPQRPARLPEIYDAPKGFIQVTAKNRDTLVSPHFRLGQFLCKQTGGYPKYVVLRSKLIYKLEYVLEKVNAQGIHSETLSVMSGYRTPSYNRAIRNVQYSRHLWGDAADIFIDHAPHDNYMDDLNGDGKLDRNDGLFLSELVDDVQSDPHKAHLAGGLGIYKSSSQHGPFVHVDARGKSVRWQN